MNKRVLVIDDDMVFLKSVQKILVLNDFDVTLISNPVKSLELIRDDEFDTIITDVKMPGLNGVELQKKILKIKPGVPVIAISGQSNIPIAIEMIKNGTYDFLEKPLDEERLIITIKNAIERKTLSDEKEYYLKELEENYRMTGKSDQFLELIERIKIVAPTEARVMITGETGTGKELVAWAIHHNSKRKDKPYLKINCASVPKELLESELFGHKKGAFTGALQDRKGKFFASEGGTLFLDEIGEMDYILQAKLLRALEENEVEVIGEDHPRKIDVRVIAATNKNLAEEIEESRFREDLFHRLNVFEIHVPPLRERKEDIMPLAKYFVEKHCLSYNKPKKNIGPQVEGQLLLMDWRGNVRELKNLMEKLVIFSEGDEITLEDFYNSENNGSHHKINSLRSSTLKEAKEKFEKEMIVKKLLKNNWQVQKTAEELGIERTNLFKKMQKFGIVKPD